MDPKSVAKMLVDSEEPSFDMEVEEGSEEVDEGQEVAAEEMMAALQANDAKSFAVALKSFLRMS